MAVTHTTVGFKGTVDQIGEARRMARMGPRFSVADAASWVVSVASGDRTVSISAGSGAACGVLDTTTGADTVQLEANGTSSTAIRYDLIVARFRWTDPVTPVAFTYVKGVPGAGASNIAGLTRAPGGQYDGVLAVVRVAGGQGALNANDIFDCRLWNTGDGPLQGNSINGFVLAAIDATEVVEISSRRQLRKIGGTWWKIAGPPELIYDNPNMGASGWVGAGQVAGIINVAVASPVASDSGKLHVVAAMQAGAGSSVGTVRVTVAGVVVSQIYNVGTSTAVPVVFDVPFSCLAGQFVMTIEVIGGSGEASFLSYSSARITI